MCLPVCRCFGLLALPRLHRDPLAPSPFWRVAMPSSTLTPTPPSPVTAASRPATAKARGRRDARAGVMPPLVRTPLREPPSYEAIIAALVRQRRESGVGFRAHGAMTVVALLDALYFEAAAKGTGTPRTGTSTLAYLMAPARGWRSRRRPR